MDLDTIRREINLFWAALIFVSLALVVMTLIQDRKINDLERCSEYRDGISVDDYSECLPNSPDVPVWSENGHERLPLSEDAEERREKGLSIDAEHAIEQLYTTAERNGCENPQEFGSGYWEAYISIECADGTQWFNFATSYWRNGFAAEYPDAEMHSATMLEIPLDSGQQKDHDRTG